MRLIRVTTATPLSRRVGGRAASLIPLALAGALCLSLPAHAGFPGNVLMAVPAGTLPVGVRAVGATITSAGTTMTVNQTSQQAILDWSSFNIAADSQVNFVQPGATAEALNRIFDASPSMIFGRLTANGRIYLINSNGILFGQGAQVNTGALIASSLAMSTDVFSAGAVSSVSKNNGRLVNLEGTLVRLDANGNAVIDTATRPAGPVENRGSIASDGGFVMLIAPDVSNKGLIVADNGQVVLAAGERVWIAPNLKGNDIDITMRGMVVEVQAGSEPVNVSSLVENLGTLKADRGNVTMVGLAVNQSGRITAGTAVNQNGSIWLLAREKQGQPGQRYGELKLGRGSVTETPLIDDGTTLADSQSYEDYRARVLLDGATVDVQGSVVSHGGIVEIGQAASTDGGALNTARVLVDSGAVIDVSGATAELAMEKNYLTFKVTSDDLKDAPNQKNGFLLGKEVTVDIRKGSPLLFDTSAAAANVRRGILEKAATGGDVRVHANEFIAKRDSTIDLSGGAWRYAAGVGKTATQLVSNKRVYDIHTASADLAYDGVLNPKVSVKDEKWGVTRTYESNLLGGGSWQAGYVDGRAAGALTLDAVSAYLAGSDIRSTVTVGPLQRGTATTPAGASLVLGDLAAMTNNAATPKLRLGDVSFGGEAGVLPDGFAIGDALPGGVAGKTVLGTGIFGSGAQTGNDTYQRSGFASVAVYSGGTVEVTAGRGIDAPAGSSLTVVGHQVAVNGDIRLPSGSVTLKARNTNDYTSGATVTVAEGRHVSAAGQWLNDSPTAAPSYAPQYIDGGRIDISGYDVTLGAGSLLDVSAGTRLNSSYKLAAGKAGAIALSAQPGTAAAGLEDFGHLTLGGELSGYGVNGSAGGTLTLTAASATLGGTARNDRDLVLGPGFFRQGGFNQYSVNGFFDTEVAAGASIRPMAQTRQIDVAAARRLANGADPGAVASPVLLPVEDRRATSLALASGYKPASPGEAVPVAVGAEGGLHVRTGAVIETDPGATVSLSSGSRMDIDGTISTPGGTIKLALKTESSAYNGQSLTVGSNARLLATGIFVPRPNVDGLLKGELKRGGTIQFDVKKNDLVIEQGAVVDVSGATATMDIASAGGAASYVRTTLGSEGGSVEISATENVRLDGSFKADGGAGAAGGNFSLDLKFHEDLNPLSDPRLDNQRHVIAVKQTQAEAVQAEAGTLRAQVSADMLQNGGFGKVRLAAEDAIEFQGNVDLTMKRAIVLDAPEIAARDGAQVRLAAGQMTLRNTPASFRPAGGYGDVATRTGTGSLQATGDLVDLAGHVTLNGFADTQLTSHGDLRASGFNVPLKTAPIPDDIAYTKAQLSGSLTTPGDLTLTAAQVYPSTAVDYKVRVANVAADGTATTAAGRSLKIRSNGAAATTPLSAGGKLRFEADRIEHDGVVKAPLGILEFVAASKLLVTDRSLTSVAADRTIPFGITADGETLFYGAVDRSATPPEKRIRFEAPDTEVAPAAQVDIGGGGELQAVEWVPGLGGSKDVLLADNTWAIVPGMRYASRDALLQGLKDLGFDKAGAIYDAVFLAAGSGLPAGYYALLPGYYGLLPGAYVVTRPAAATALADMNPGSAIRLANGQTAVAGRFASSASGETEARWSGFVVRAGSEVLKEAEYRISDSSFYANAAAAADRSVPQLPADAGGVAFVATNALALGGVLRTLPAAGGRIGEVDIAAPNLAVVSQAGAGAAPAGFVQVDAARLSALNASVMLGGTRSGSAEGTAVDVVAGEVRVSNDADHAVTTPEFVAVARDRVQVDGGALVEASGSSATSGRDLLINAGDSGGALLRLSAGAPVRVLRGAGRGANLGVVEVAAGSELRTSRSMLLDATSTTRVFGRLTLPEGGAASFAAQKVSLGETPADADGLVMDRNQLAAFGALGSLTLRSYSTIDLYGNASFGNAGRGSLTLDAAGIVGHAVDGRNDATVAAASLALANSGTATAALAGGSGTLTLAGQNVSIGAGDKVLSGYGDVTIAASGELGLTGKGSLKAGGNLALEAARISAAGKSIQTIQAGDETMGWRNVAIRQAANAAAITAQAAAGGQLAILGKRVEQAGNIDLPSGVLTLHAFGSDAGDDVVLSAGSHTAAGGYARNFAGTAVATSGGKVVLESEHGSVDMASGAELDVAGTSGGDAGELVVRAVEGQARLGGTLAGGATAGGKSGSATLDVGSLANFSELNQALQAGGFANEISARARHGDVAVAAGDRVVARSVALTVDDGRLDVAGTIDASGAAGGGRIVLAAKNDINLQDGSVLDARGTSAAIGAADAYSHGGKVEVGTVDGRLNFAANASIDASAAAAGKSNGGEVVFSAARTTRGDGTPGVNMNLAGRVKVSGGGTPASAGSVIVEGRQTYTGVGNTAAYVAPDAGNPVWNDYQAYMNNVAAIRGDLALKNLDGSAFDPAAVRVRAGIELQNSGDIAHTAGWNLVQDGWRLGGEAGRLTLRAAGNLTISNYLGFPNDSLPTGETWSLRLVGGADTGSANALATNANNTGDVTLATTTARVTSGTGDIDIAAGRNFSIANVANTRAAVYTAGSVATSDYSGSVEGGNYQELNRYGANGGDIDIKVGGKATGPAAAVAVNDWLRRNTTFTPGASTIANGRWWVHRPTFRGGVGVLGGGNLSIAATAGIENLGAAVATGGYTRTAASGQAALVVTGGGNLNLHTDGDIVGGNYLIGRGSGNIFARGSFGSGTATALYLMGESGDPALRHASFAVEATGDVSLKSASNPTITALTNVTGVATSTRGFGNTGESFFTYSDDASLRLVSTAGDVTPMAAGLDYLNRLYPASVTLAALQGSAFGIVSDDLGTASWIPYSSEYTGVKLFSAGTISNQHLRFGDGAWENLPHWSNPIVGAVKSANGIQDVVTRSISESTRSRVVVPAAGEGQRYMVVALDGDVRDSYFEFPQSARIEAGGDLVNVTANLQNVGEGDLSVIRAGGDIRYTRFTPSGASVHRDTHYFRIGGPGRLLVQAGGNIDFGQAAGINAVGNADNRSLTTDKSAALTVLAGVKQDVDVDAIDALFPALRDGVIKAKLGFAAGEAAGDRLIEPLFGNPGDGAGNIRMVYSTILTQGDSPVQVLAPHGRIDVGLPTAIADRPLGIVTAAGGAIDILVRDDILVNLSKVITMLGGDLTIYSQRGGIDAGRGPRDSLSAVGPKVVAVNVINPAGQSVDTGLRRYRPPIDAAGSGIRTMSYDPDGTGPLQQPRPGDIYLRAHSFIDAGEAGIDAVGGFYGDAPLFRNADNIAAGSGTTGVPASDSSALAGIAGAAGATSAATTKPMESTANNAPAPSFKPSFITVEVLGIGE